MTMKTLKVNKAEENGLAFGVEVMEVGKAFHGTFVATGKVFHGVGYQAKTEAELQSDFELFKSGFAKLQKLIDEGYQKCVPKDLLITFKEVRIMAGGHPAILAERVGISSTYLKRLENGEAKQSLTWDQALAHYQSTYLQGMKMDFIDWSTKQQKKPLHSAK